LTVTVYIQRVLSQLPEYLQVSAPRGVPVLRLRAPAQTAWTITREALSLEWADQTRTYALLDWSLAELGAALQADGFAIDWRAEVYDDRGAIILHPGSGVGTDLNWTADVAVLHSFTRPLEAALDAVRVATPDLAAQVSLMSAQADWLDHHGQLYGVARDPDRTDSGYRDDIMAAILRPRNTPRGMEENLRHLGDGTAVRVREPWQEIAILSDDAMLSTDQHLQGAPIWQYHTIQLVSPSAHAWPRWLAIANADRPAGTLMLDPATQPATQVLDLSTLAPALAGARVDWFGQRLAPQGDFWLSDNLVLSDSRPPPLWRVSRIEVRAQVTTGLRPPSDIHLWIGAWDQRIWRAPPAYEFYPPTEVAAPPSGSDLPDPAGLPDGATLQVISGTWMVETDAGWVPTGGLSMGVDDVPDPTGLPDGATLQVIGGAWMVETASGWAPVASRPPSPSGLPDPAEAPDGAMLQVVNEQWVISE
jgi:hypothetical protein